MPEITTIDNHRVVAWGQGITHLQQQRTSRLRMGVMVDTDFTGKRKSYDQIEARGDPVEITTRHADTVRVDAEHRRRNIIPKNFGDASIVDEEDLLRVLNDPRDAINESIAMAFRRKQDKIIIAAFDATAITGEDGLDTAAFDTAFSIASGAAGFSIDKWANARELLEAAENEEDGDGDGAFRWYTVLAARQRRQLLATTEFTSSDFATVQALANGGKVNEFLGFSLVKSQFIPLAAGERAVFAWVKKSMKLGVQKEARSRVDPLPEKWGNWQVMYKSSYGATRMDEKGVVRIYNTET